MLQNDRNVLFVSLEMNDVILKHFLQNQFQIVSNLGLDKRLSERYNFRLHHQT